MRDLVVGEGSNKQGGYWVADSGLMRMSLFRGGGGCVSVFVEPRGQMRPFVRINHPDLWALYHNLGEGVSLLPIVDWLLENLDPDEHPQFIANLCALVDIPCII